MTMFGIDIAFETNRAENGSVDKIVNSVLKRDSERKVFNDFLKSSTSDGEIVIQELARSAKAEAEEKLETGFGVGKDELVNFATLKLKQNSLHGISEYDSIVRKIVEELEPSFKKLHVSLKSGKFDGRLPLGYPDTCKKAAGILEGKIKDDIGRLELPYLTEKILTEKIRLYSREMFFCINNGSPEIARNYLCLRHEMYKLRSAEELNSNDIKNAIIRSLITDKELVILSPKCMRFTYPEGNRLKILNHIDEEIIIKKDGSKYLLTQENKYLLELIKIKNIFESYGIRTNFKVLVMDRDLLDYFPEDGGGIVPSDDIEKSYQYINEYINKLSEYLISHGIETTSFTNFLSPELLKKFLSLKNERLSRAKRGELMAEKFIEERVEYYFESKKNIFKNAPDRQFSRDRVYSELVSQQSLDIFNYIYDNYIVVSDNLFNMSKVLGNGKIPVYFADLGKVVGFNVE